MNATERLRAVDFPQSSVGAPLPHVFADDYRLLIGYIMQIDNPEWDGSTVRVVEPESEGETCAIIEVESYLALQFGPPNDEAIAGHRLYKLGLTPYSSFEVINSKWIANLETANRVHPYHRTDHFARYRHIILTFHDSTLEFIATGFVVRQVQGSIRAALLDALKEQNSRTSPFG